MHTWIQETRTEAVYWLKPRSLSAHEYAGAREFDPANHPTSSPWAPVNLAPTTLYRERGWRGKGVFISSYKPRPSDASVPVSRYVLSKSMLGIIENLVEASMGDRYCWEFKRLSSDATRIEKKDAPGAENLSEFITFRFLGNGLMNRIKKQGEFYFPLSEKSLMFLVLRRKFTFTQLPHRWLERFQNVEDIIHLWKSKYIPSSRR